MNPVHQILVTPGGQIHIRPFSEGTTRITYTPVGCELPADRLWLNDVLNMPAGLPAQDDKISFTLQDDRLVIQSAELMLKEAQPAVLQSDGCADLWLSTTAYEIFYGGGEWFNAFARQNGHIHLENRESPAILQGKQTYSNIPLFFSSRGYAIFLLNSYPSDWQIDSEHSNLHLHITGNGLDFLLIRGETPKKILERYTGITGRPPLLPRWAFGLWVTSYPQEHQDKVVEFAAQHRQQQIPLDAIILDYHWEEKFHNFRWRSSLFPNPDVMIRSLNAVGVRTGLIFTPFVNNRNGWIKKLVLDLAVRNVNHSVWWDDERALPEYQYAIEQGYFAHKNTTWWFGGGGMLDFTNPQASQWWNNLLKPLYEQGVAFFKNDDGEYLPKDAYSSNGMDGREYHNLYGFYYSRAIYDGMQALDNRRALIYARSVWAGSQRYPAIFLGDQKPDFTNLRRAMRAGLNMSLLGFAYWTADTFGLDGKTTPETHMRQAQWALFSPIARYFLRLPEIDDTRYPWAHNEQVENNFRKHIELRYRLLPYYHLLGWEAYKKGVPLIRPMFLEFPFEPGMQKLDDQFMLGANLLFAPVCQAGVVERKVTFPAGNWYSWWDDQLINGGQELILPVLADELPLFVRAGSILPMGPALQHIPDEHRFDQLDLHFWPPFSGQLNFIEDDGISRGYQEGQFSNTIFNIKQSGSEIEIQVNPDEGNFLDKSSAREMRFILHGLKNNPQSVQVNAQPDIQWSYDPKTQILTVKNVCQTEIATRVRILI